MRAPLATLLLLAACTAPPPEAYVRGRAPGASPSAAVAIGANATG